MKSATMMTLTLLLAVLIGGGAWLYTPDKSRPALEAIYLKPSDQYRMVAGIRLRVRESGRRDAPVVILLHGFGASLQTWEAWAECLSADYWVVRFDLPGFGLTGPDPTGDYSDRRSLDVLTALMDQLGLKRASVVGNSLGGRIAWKFAAAYPSRVDKLVLISPDGFATPGFEYGKKPNVPFMLKLLPYMLPKALLRVSLAPAYGDPQKLTDSRLMRYRDLMLAPGVRDAMVARMAQIMLEDPTPLLRRIEAPTLILWGKEDAMIPFSNAADYVRDIPRATLVALPGVGHVPFEEAPEASVKPVERFLGSGNGVEDH
jgi:pimeloyl-ACP methyl ester carboxylesterase